MRARGVELFVVAIVACDYQEIGDVRAGRRSVTAPPEVAPAPVSAPLAEEPAGGAGAASPSPAPSAPDDDPGPPPTGCAAITKDASGFFRRSSPKSDYVGFVPTSYTGQPMRLFVGLHGCGDDAYDFATWGVAPYDTRATQDWLGISVEDTNGGGHCWSQSDDDVVLAAIDDVAKCFYVHRHEIVIGGFSSGGELAYGLGLRHADRFAGILVECATASAAGKPAPLLAGAQWSLPIAHVAHRGDTVFPIATVRADWSLIEQAGLPLETRVMEGGHDGQTSDWAGWLLPRMAGWRSP